MDDFTATRVPPVTAAAAGGCLVGQEDRRWLGAKLVGQNFKTPRNGFAAATSVAVFS